MFSFKFAVRIGMVLAGSSLLISQAQSSPELIRLAAPNNTEADIPNLDGEWLGYGYDSPGSYAYPGSLKVEKITISRDPKNVHRFFAKYTVGDGLYKAGDITWWGEYGSGNVFGVPGFGVFVPMRDPDDKPQHRVLLNGSDNLKIVDINHLELPAHKWKYVRVTGNTNVGSEPSNISVTAEWVTNPFDFHVTERPGLVVHPLSFDAKGNVTLRLRATTNHSPGSLAVDSLQLVNDWKQATWPAPAGLLSGITFDSSGIATISFSQTEVLANLSSKVNTNLILASVTISDRNSRGSKASSRSKQALDLLKQKLILFIPGVCGSEMSASGHQGERMFLSDDAHAEFLRCDSNGNPMPGNDSKALDLFRTLNPIGDFHKQVARTAALAGQTTIYSVENQAAVISPAGYPTLRDSANKKVPYFVVQPWPYDWRLALETSISYLLGDAQPPQKSNPRALSAYDMKLLRTKTVAPYDVPPSIRAVLLKAEIDYPFIDSKVAIACHSTGGLVTRGLLSHPESTELVDHAFFVDVPFYGAPKAYNVFMTGAGMTEAPKGVVQFIDRSTLINLAPNFPIVYYLAPSAKYRGPVISIGAGSGIPALYRADQVGTAMPALVAAARAKGLYPNGRSYYWNVALQNKAAQFHASIGIPSIGWNNCLAFCSDIGPATTIGAQALDKEGLSTFPTNGDGTVPLASQMGDVPQDRVRMIPSKPAHVPSPNEPWVWQQIINELMK